MRARVLAGAALTLCATGCSALFGGGRYTGGSSDADAGMAVEDDAFVPSDEDAGTPVDAARPVDANESVPCTDDRACAADDFCDRARSVCAPCDADGDGVLHQACVTRAGGLAWDCEPDARAEVRSVRASAFAHTLRAFLGTEELHVLYTSDETSPGIVRHARFGAGVPSDGALSDGSIGLIDYDAARAADRVVIVGYDALSANRFELEGDTVSLKAARAFGGLDASGYGGLVPSGPPMLVRADTESAFLGFSASWGSGMGGRVVMDVGGDSSFGSHIATFHERGASPSAVRFATGPNVALMPNDMTESNPFLLWAGDVRDFGSNHDPRRFDVGSLQVGQLAVTRLEGGQNIVALGAVSVGDAGGSSVRLAVGLASCNTSDETDCPFTTVDPAPQLEVDGMEQAAVAAIGVSPRTVFFATSAPRAFRIGNLDLCPAGASCSPAVPTSPVGTLPIPAPMMDGTRAVAVDLRGNPSTGMLTLGLARASRTEIQAVRVNLCFAPES
jgi:hypothetical protein